MNKSLFKTWQTVLVASAVSLSVGCSKVKFDKPQEEKNTVQATPTPDPDSSSSDAQEGFEVSSGGVIDASDASGEIILSGTAGSPVETLQVSETATDDTLSTGFWSLFNVF